MVVHPGVRCGRYGEPDGKVTPMPPDLNPADCRLHIKWYPESAAPVDARLNDVPEMVEHMLQHDLYPVEITSDCPDLARLLEHIFPLGRLGGGEVTINDRTYFTGANLSGGATFVPETDKLGVDTIASGSSSWLSGGPCVFDQFEDIIRVGDLYWVDTVGDAQYRRLFVGRFTDPDEGLAAAVRNSFFFRLDDKGEPVCELDSWPQDE